MLVLVFKSQIRMCLPGLTLGHGGGHERPGNGVGTVGHGDVAGLGLR